MLLIDFVLHLVYYGPATIYKLKKEYVYEGVLQLISIGMIVSYYCYNKDRVEHLISIVEAMALLLLFRLPIICVLFTEVKDF